MSVPKRIDFTDVPVDENALSDQKFQSEKESSIHFKRHVYILLTVGTACEIINPTRAVEKSNKILGFLRSLNFPIKSCLSWLLIFLPKYASKTLEEQQRFSFLYVRWEEEARVWYPERKTRQGLDKTIRCLQSVLEAIYWSLVLPERPRLLQRMHSWMSFGPEERYSKVLDCFSVTFNFSNLFFRNFCCQIFIRIWLLRK